MLEWSEKPETRAALEEALDKYSNVKGPPRMYVWVWRQSLQPAFMRT